MFFRLLIPICLQTLQSSLRNKELPLRVAYEQLDELAANAEKVKSAIEKNRAILNVQVQDTLSWVVYKLFSLIYKHNKSSTYLARAWAHNRVPRTHPRAK